MLGKQGVIAAKGQKLNNQEIIYTFRPNSVVCPMPEIYHTNLRNTARFTLGQYTHNRPLLVISLNPSQATLAKLDTTVSKVKGFASRLGHDGFLMLNLYPQRSTDPKGLHKRQNKQLVSENLQAIEQAVSQLPNPVIWAAWGNLIETRPYLPNCLSAIHFRLLPYHPQWLHIGALTKAGHPRHPSRMGYQESANPFDIDTYLRNIL